MMFQINHLIKSFLLTWTSFLLLFSEDKLFGRRNVDRWRRQGKVVCYKRPGKVEYKTADLRMLQKTTQDYFESPPLSSITSIKKTVKHTK